MVVASETHVDAAPSPRIHAHIRAAGGRRDDYTMLGAGTYAVDCADYTAMRDTGEPYSGDPRKNKLLPLPRPTYTEFINRARAARMLDRLDFLYVAADAPQPPPWASFARYERVVWCGVSFRRFARLWTPERHHFFVPEFQQRVLAVLCCAKRNAHLGALPLELLHAIVAASAGATDARRDDYDDRATIESGARHLFLPAPGSAGVREALFDAVFGLA